MTSLSLLYFFARQSHLCCKIKSPAINIVPTSQQHLHHQTEANHSTEIQPARFEGRSKPCVRNIVISTIYANLLPTSWLNYLLETFEQRWSELPEQIYRKNKLRRSQFTMLIPSGPLLLVYFIKLQLGLTPRPYGTVA